MDDWLGRLKQTMAIDLARGMSAGMPPRALIDLLFDIPEVSQAFHLRENRRRPLALDPSTDEERREIVDALDRVATWLDDGFHEVTVSELRSIAEELRA